MLALHALLQSLTSGTDGFQPIFFKTYWETVATDIWNMIAAAFSTGVFEPSLAETLIVPIPKMTSPTSLKEYRPISLCNVLSKVLVNKIRPHLSSFIGPVQSSFIPNRGTCDNALVTQEVVHHMHNKKGKQGYIMFKIDFEKAYDRVNWDFLKITLHEFGFPEQIVQLILNCTTASRLTLKWNGDKLDSFAPNRGMRQGDPMSPYLFVLCMEKLSLLIRQKVQANLWKPVAISRTGPAISHLFFVNDCLLFAQAKAAQVRLIKQTLDDFCKASGLKANIQKSQFLVSRNVSQVKIAKYVSISHFQHTLNIGKYLGFPILSGRVKNDDFGYILERINSRIAGWKSKLLNRAGRVCLAQSVLNSMPVYTMQNLRVPYGVCDRIDKSIRHFIWGEDHKHWVKWDTVTLPKARGASASVLLGRQIFLSLGNISGIVCMRKKSFGSKCYIH